MERAVRLYLRPARSKRGRKDDHDEDALGLVRPTRGAARIAGFDSFRDSIEIRKLAAFVPEQKMIYRELRVRDFLKYYGQFFPNWSPETAMRHLDAWGVPLSRRIGHLSKGMTTKLFLSAAFARNARLLLLDEPTEGLDPASIEDLLSSLTSWVAEGEGSIVLASHRLEEVERICDHVGFMQEGRLILTAELDDLRCACKKIDADVALPAEMVRSWDEVRKVAEFGTTLRVTTSRCPGDVVDRLKGLGAKNVTVHDLNLREIYLSMCGSPKEVAS